MGARKRVTESPVSACEALGLLLQPLHLGLGETLLPCWPIFRLLGLDHGARWPQPAVCAYMGTEPGSQPNQAGCEDPASPPRLSSSISRPCRQQDASGQAGLSPLVCILRCPVTILRAHLGPSYILGTDQPGGELKEVGRVLKKRPFIK